MYIYANWVSGQLLWGLWKFARGMLNIEFPVDCRLGREKDDIFCFIIGMS